MKLQETRSCLTYICLPVTLSIVPHVSINYENRSAAHSTPYLFRLFRFSLPPFVPERKNLGCSSTSSPSPPLSAATPSSADEHHLASSHAYFGHAAHMRAPGFAHAQMAASYLNNFGKAHGHDQLTQQLTQQLQSSDGYGAYAGNHWSYLTGSTAPQALAQC